METWSLALPMPTLVADYEIVRTLGAGNNGRFLLAVRPRGWGCRRSTSCSRSSRRAPNAHTSSSSVSCGSAAVNSPHLVRVYDAVLSDNFALATEYLPLGTLAAPGRPLERTEVLTALRDAARGAHALHEAGLAHSDIKPANVGLADGAEGIIGKLSDLGLARFLDPGPR